MLKHIIRGLVIQVFFMAGLQAYAKNLPALDSLINLPTYHFYLDSAAQYEKEGKYREATFYFDKGIRAYKEHYRNQLDAINTQLATTYETDKKEQEYERLNQTLALKKTETILFTTLIIILIVSLILSYIAQKYRLRSVRQQRLQKENETIYLKLEKEKKELEAQLNTLQAEKYQKELLAGTLLVEYKNSVLEELQLFFENHPTLSNFTADMEQIMAEKTMNEQQSPEFDTNLQQIHPVFYAHLQKQANNKLTPLDLKYCRMIYLRMSSKEMADILQVDPKTIRVTKYRLKQKLGLGKEEDLGDFIEKMV